MKLAALSTVLLVALLSAAPAAAQPAPGPNGAPRGPVEEAGRMPWPGAEPLDAASLARLSGGTALPIRPPGPLSSPGVVLWDELRRLPRPEGLSAGSLTINRQPVR